MLNVLAVVGSGDDCFNIEMIVRLLTILLRAATAENDGQAFAQASASEPTSHSTACDTARIRGWKAESACRMMGFQIQFGQGAGQRIRTH